MRTVHVLPADLNAPCRALRRVFSAGAALTNRPSNTEKVRRPKRFVTTVFLVSAVLASAVLLALGMVTALTSPASAATITLRPDGAGDETTLSRGGSPAPATNWEAVDEPGSGDGDGTYVYHSLGTYGTDLYALPATGFSGAIISSVTVYMNCRAAATPNQSSAQTRIKTNAVAYPGTAVTLNSDLTYGTFSTAYATNPNTTNAWTWTEIDALQAGVGLKKATKSGSTQSQCTQVWVEVSYTPRVATASGSSIAPGAVSPGATEVGIEKLNLVTDAGEATWTEVKVDLTGTAADADILSVEIWSDDGDEIWEGEAGDTEIGAGTFSSGTVTIDIIDQTINTSSQVFYVVYDIAVGADPSHTAGAELVDSSYITVTGPATVSSSGFPMSSNETSLPVGLSSFTAADSAGVVIVRWTVQSEVDNAWFNLLRRATPATENMPG